jgi:hypothetical protein
VSRRIILKTILEKYTRRHGLDSSRSGQGPMGGSYGDLSDSMKYCEILE